MGRISLKAAVLAVFSVVLFLSAAVYAQGGPGRRFDVNARVSELKERLTLTDKQADDVKKILVASQEEAAKDREKFAGNFDEMRKSRIARFQDQDKKIIALLNDKQKEEYNKVIKEREQRMNR